MTCLVYGKGLSGPFLFDDAINFTPIAHWLHGDASWQSVVFGNISGPLGRPVSMATFLLSAKIGGLDPLHFKLFNLCLHLACGVLGYTMLKQVLRLDERLRDYASPVATVLTALWLLHPLHASTVLYAVQRMAQLSTLFVLASVVIYLHARRSMWNGRNGLALALLFAAWPAAFALGLLSKENAAVAPLLCLVLEAAYFSRDVHSRRVLAVFYSLFLAVPAAVALLVLCIEPDRLLAGYSTLDFTLTERLLSQPRALMTYVGMLLYPRGAQMGVFTDGFTTSIGLFSPVTTAYALTAMAVITGLVISLGRRYRSLFAGWLFFLAAHAVESTFLPLDLYYEHRNYLPSFGLLLAIAGLASALPGAAKASRPVRAVFAVFSTTLILLWGAITIGQAHVWRSKDALIEQAVENHPRSVRAMQAKIIGEINKARYDSAMALLSQLAGSQAPRTRVLAHLDMVSVSCLRGRDVRPQWLDAAVRDARDNLTVGEVQAVAFLVQVSSRDGRCAPLSQAALAAYVAAIAQAATAQSDGAQPKSQLRYASALLYSRAEQWADATAQAELAWQPGAPVEIGGLLAESYVRSNRKADAERIYPALESRVGPHDKAGQQMLVRIRAMLRGMDKPGENPAD